MVGYEGEGSAARFFYCPKVSKSERNRGVDSNKTSKVVGHNRFDKCATCGGYLLQNPNRPSACKCKNPVRQDNTMKGNIHPTVKPVELMKYLCRLVTPKGGTILDPFMGSGSTGMAAKDEGFEFIGIEKEKEYFEIAEQRIIPHHLYWIL
jgi:site-specific DNA-methyltransferase (adenine-specific)